IVIQENIELTPLTTCVTTRTDYPTLSGKPLIISYRHTATGHKTKICIFGSPSRPLNHTFQWSCTLTNVIRVQSYHWIFLHNYISKEGNKYSYFALIYAITISYLIYDQPGPK
ncbi:hypothetical protein WA026_009432, partial [Henosepilachna vigintioctopunctata]